MMNQQDPKQLLDLMQNLAKATPEQQAALAEKLAIAGVDPPPPGAFAKMGQSSQPSPAPVPQQQFPATGGAVPQVRPVNPQQPQAVNQALGVTKSQNPFLV